MARPAPVSTIRYPLNAILGAESNVRLLRELCLHGGYVSATQLAERTGLVRNSTWDALNSLRQYGLVVEEGTDRSRLFRFNSEHPLGDLIGQLFGAESEGFKISSKGPSKKARRNVCQGRLLIARDFSKDARNSNDVADPGNIGNPCNVYNH